jgi:DNA repair photolyase
MIISASRRTDIPALYAEWFINRLREGNLQVQNPFNSSKYSWIELAPDKIDAIVFWTKNPKPILKHLKDIDGMGYNYYFQFTLTGYPKSIEPSLPKLHDRLLSFKNLSTIIGPDKVIWRYDPIIISDITSEEYIIDNFKYLARELNKFTKRVVVSFADFYKKAKRNFTRIKKEQNITFYDINSELDHIYNISSNLSNIAKGYSLNIFSCAEKIDLSGCGISDGKCIDDDLIEYLFKKPMKFSKDKNQRKDCGCVQSKDVGQYNSCTHDCVYCYANSSKTYAQHNRSKHNPSSSTLIGNGMPYKGTQSKQLNLLQQIPVN